jgi:biopolymer transport protein ExbD
MPRTRRRFPNAEIEANLTPMIDVSFLLIVFFVLVMRITDAEQAELAVPAVREGVAIRPEDEARAVLNVIPGEGGVAAGYLLGGEEIAATPEGIALLAERLADGYRRNPRLAVRLRADRATRFEWVEPAMRAVNTAARMAGGDALPRLDLVVTPLAGGGGGTSGDDDSARGVRDAS